MIKIQGFGAHQFRGLFFDKNVTKITFDSLNIAKAERIFSLNLISYKYFSIITFSNRTLIVQA